MRFRIQNLMILIALAGLLLGCVMAYRRFTEPTYDRRSDTIYWIEPATVTIEPPGYLLPAAIIAIIGVVAWKRWRRRKPITDLPSTSAKQQA